MPLGENGIDEGQMIQATIMGQVFLLVLTSVPFELDPVVVVGRSTRWGKIGHPDEFISAATQANLRTAVAAEPFLFYTSGWLGGERVPGVPEAGVCIEGAELESLVDALLDPDSYTWPGLVRGGSYLSRKVPRPQFGIRFLCQGGDVVLESDPQMTAHRLLPCNEGPVGNSRAVYLDRDILRPIAVADFPDVGWSFLR